MWAQAAGPQDAGAQAGVLVGAAQALGSIDVDVIALGGERCRVEQICPEEGLHPGELPFTVIQVVGDVGAAVDRKTDISGGVDVDVGAVAEQADAAAGVRGDVIAQLQAHFLFGQGGVGHGLCL